LSVILFQDVGFGLSTPGWVMLIAEGLHQHVPKGYIYFAMVFAVFIEVLNIRMRAKPATDR
jgi:predicted tellurium resistance membrane protein TerC